MGMAAAARRFRVGLGVALVAVLVTACSIGGGSSPSSSGPSKDSFRWKSCGDGAQCAELQVPLDYANPDGPQISVALLRFPATGTARGSLLLNPGGPGAPGTEFLRSTGRGIVSADVAAEYDLVSWDTRGTGGTIPANCGDRLDYLFDGVTYEPVTPDQQSALVRVTQRFVDACKTNMGSELGFVGSRETVQDMERIRAALGDEQLNFLGFSYGTYLGARYAAQYPDRVGRFVLDGAVNPALSMEESTTQQSVGFDRSLDAFFASCGVQTTCGYAAGSTPRDAYLALRDRVARQPVTAGLGTAVGQAQLDIGTARFLYSGAVEWPELAQALLELGNGDGEYMFASFSAYVDRSEAGLYSPEYAAYNVITCADFPAIGDPQQTFAAARQARDVAPIFGATSINLNLACSLWPVAATSTPAPVAAPGAGPIVVIGTVGDPATPLRLSEELSAQLSSARLIVAPGSQHTSYGQGNTCVDAAVDDYLLEVGTPDARLVCAA